MIFKGGPVLQFLGDGNAWSSATERKRKSTGLFHFCSSIRCSHVFCLGLETMCFQPTFPTLFLSPSRLKPLQPTQLLRPARDEVREGHHVLLLVVQDAAGTQLRLPWRVPRRSEAKAQAEGGVFPVRLNGGRRLAFCFKSLTGKKPRFLHLDLEGEVGKGKKHVFFVV